MAFPVSFFQIQGEDPNSLIKFYQKAFDWQGEPAPDGGLMVAPEAGGIAGAVGPSRDGSAHLAIYVTVENVTKHLARAKRAGARVVMPETALPGNMGSIGGILDPAGNWLGLWAAGAAGAPAPPQKLDGAASQAAPAVDAAESAGASSGDGSMSTEQPSAVPAKKARAKQRAAKKKAPKVVPATPAKAARAKPAKKSKAKRAPAKTAKKASAKRAPTKKRAGKVAQKSMGSKARKPAKKSRKRSTGG